jgi:hypothetical protein
LSEWSIGYVRIWSSSSVGTTIPSTMRVKPAIGDPIASTSTRIHSSLERAVEAILETGRLLQAA